MCDTCKEIGPKHEARKLVLTVRELEVCGGCADRVLGFVRSITINVLQKEAEAL